MNKVKLTDEKEVKKAILGKYGYVDKEEDGRYHRPMVKKLVRNVVKEKMDSNFYRGFFFFVASRRRKR